MWTINDNFLKRIFIFILVLSLASPGVVGIFVSLFPPNGAQLSLSETLTGLVFSSIFLLTAWVAWKWSQTCVLCDLNHSPRKLHH